MGVKSGNDGTVSLDKFPTAECKVQRVFSKTASYMYMHVVMWYLRITQHFFPPHRHISVTREMNME